MLQTGKVAGVYVLQICEMMMEAFTVNGYNINNNNNNNNNNNTINDN